MRGNVSVEVDDSNGDGALFGAHAQSIPWLEQGDYPVAATGPSRNTRATSSKLRGDGPGRYRIADFSSLYRFARRRRCPVIGSRVWPQRVLSPRNGRGSAVRRRGR